MPATAADGPTQDIAAPRQRIQPGPGPGSKPARRRRYLTITLAGTLLAAATAISLLLAMPGAARPPTGSNGGTPAATPTASRERTQPATPSGSPTATPTASGKKSEPLTGTLTATLSNPAGQGVNSVAFSPSGTTLAAGDQNGNAYLWRISRRSP